MPRIQIEPDGWTTETPKWDGMYINRQAGEYQLVEIEMHFHSAIAFVPRLSCPQDAEDVGGEWYGPIEIVQLTGD